MIRETTAPQDITWLKIDEVYPYECNNKIHNQPEITKIANSIKEFGWTYPILIDENNIILAGHKRLQAAKQLGLTEVPTIRKDDLSDAQKRAYRIIDNKSSEESEYDPTNLTLELDEIKALDFDISKFINLNFDLDKIGETQDLDAQEDDYDAEPPVEPKTKLGDLYKLGKHRLLCGDATKDDDIKRLIADTKIDMIYTDPPYGMDLDTDFSSWKSNPEWIEKHCRGGRKYDKNWVDDFDPKMIDKIFSLNVKETFIWGADYFTELLKDRNDGSWIVWDKRGNDESIEKSYSADKMYGSCFELCWSRKKHKREIARVKWAGVFGIEQEFDHKRHHPTQKPVKLSEWFLKNYGHDNDNVLDLFGGSGSTLIACEQLDRQCYMMELDPAYCDVIIKRWEDFTGRKAEKIN